MTRQVVTDVSKTPKSFETSVTNYKSTWPNIRENLKLEGFLTVHLPHEII